MAVQECSIDIEDMDESTRVFRFNLPDGLSLRSVSVVDDVTKLRFTASPKVPTLQEGDIATAFRLAAERKRPEFFYINFPSDHPLHSSRWLKYYRPKWLRGTSLGELLANVDWNMKCLHIGARSNEDKTTFKSWPKSSNLKGLATRLDFPRKDNMLSGSIIMYCDHVKVQIKEDEIIFPEEPKMKIIDQFSESYSAYITEHLPSVAYYDEPKFLKMQEVIKLILAVEWLYNEKKVRVNQSWVQFHTENISEEQHVTLIESFPEREEAPPEMVPTPPPDFAPPSTDVTICTANSEMYNALVKDGGVNLRYGYMDFGGCEVRIFTDDGEVFLFQDCMKYSSIMHYPRGIIKSHMYVTLDNELYKKVRKILGSMKYSFLSEESDDNDDNPTPELPTLQLPKISLMLQVQVAPDIAAAFSVKEFKIASKGQSENSESSQICTDGTKRASNTAAKSNIPITESPTCKDSEEKHSQDKEDLSIIEASKVLPPKENFNKTKIPSMENMLAETAKIMEDKNILSPLEVLLENLDDSSADDSAENEELMISTMKACMASRYKAMFQNFITYPATICVSVDKFSFEEDINVSLNVLISRHAPFTLPHFEITGTLKWGLEDMDFIFAHCDPNAPISLPMIIPGLHAEFIPGVSSWEELLSEMSTPIPRFWQDPYTGTGIRSDTGGVSTSQIPVLPVLSACGISLAASYALLKNFTPKVESADSPPKVKLPKFKPPTDSTSPSETENVQNNESSSPANKPAFPHNNENKDKKKRRAKQRQIEGNMDKLVVRSSHIKVTIKSVNEKTKAAVTDRFNESWNGYPPEVIAIFKINDSELRRQWNNYGELLEEWKTPEEYYHGSSLLCDIAGDKKLCNEKSCDICTTLRDGFNDQSCKRHRSFSKFEENYILDRHSSSSDKHNEENTYGCKAVLLCDVLPGRKYNTQTQEITARIPDGYDSISAITEDDLHSPIIIVPNYEAIFPRFIIVYKHSN